MTRIQMDDPAPSEKLRTSEKIMDPCCGTGRMLLHASNISLRLYGMDIDPLVTLIAKINGALYVPWLAYPFRIRGLHHLRMKTIRRTPRRRRRNLSWYTRRRSSDQLKLSLLLTNPDSLPHPAHNAGAYWKGDHAKLWKVSHLWRGHSDRARTRRMVRTGPALSTTPRTRLEQFFPNRSRTARMRGSRRTESELPETNSPADQPTPTGSVTADENPFADMEIISRYTRAEAMADGSWSRSRWRHSRNSASHFPRR
ncbi:MAG: hypothetical protein IPK92_15865 [Nitrospira sp.]|nr:hypothetical protein [Nitrospira sp.]